VKISLDVLQEQKTTMTEQMQEILSTAVALNATSEYTLNLIRKRIQQIGGTDDLHAGSTNVLYTKAQKMMMDRFVDLLAIDISKSASHCAEIISNWIVANFRTGKVIDSRDDRIEREEIFEKALRYLKDKGISQDFEMVALAYVDVFYLLLTTENREYVEGVFLELKTILQNRKNNKKKVVKPPTP
jgi:hypothetical protein